MTARTIVFAIVCTLWCTGNVLAIHQAETEPRKFFLIVGGSNQEPKSEEGSSASINSAVELTKTLQTFHGMVQPQRGQVRLLANTRQLSVSAPTHRNVTNALNDIQDLATKEDEVWFVYFGSVVEHNEQACLLTESNHSTRLGERIVLAEVTRELRRTQAKRIVMLIDHCRVNDSDRLENWLTQENSVDQWRDRCVKEIEDDRFVFVFGAERGKFGAQWESQRMHHLGFWLNQGLKGAAGVDVHGEISLRRLIDFANEGMEASQRNIVLETANLFEENLTTEQQEGLRQQTEIQGNPVAISQVKLSLTPTTFAQSMDVLAHLIKTQLDVHSRGRGVKHVAIKEFQEYLNSGEEQASELRSANGAWFGRIASDHLYQRLAIGDSPSFEYISPREFGQRFVSFKRDDVSTTGATSQAIEYVVESLVDYEVENGRIQIHSELVDERERTVLSRFVTYVSMDSELQTLLAGDRALVAKPISPVASDVTESNEADLRERHRLANDSSGSKATEVTPIQQESGEESLGSGQRPPQELPRLEITIQRRVKGGTYFTDVQTTEDTERQARMFTARHGEVYRFRIRNNSARHYAIVPMIDGRSVLGNKEGLTIEKCVDEAKYFIVNPDGEQFLSYWYEREKQAVDRKTAEYKLSEFEVQEYPVASQQQEKLENPLPEIRFGIYEVRDRYLDRFADARTIRYGFGTGATFNENVRQETEFVADLSKSAEIQVFRYVSD